MKHPDLLHRTVIANHFSGGLRAPDKSYEVLAEMTEMWWQAVEAAGVLSDNPPDQPGAEYLADLAVATGKWQAWEQAIAVYAGWNGLQLQQYLDQVKADKLEGARA